MPATAFVGDYLASRADWYRDLTSIARVAVVRSEPSRLWGSDGGRMDGAADQSGHIAEYRGLCELLSDLRHPYDLILSPGFSLEELQRYELVILPGVTCLSDDEAAVIDAYVEGGGRILVSGEFASSDGHGKRRERPAIRALPALPGEGRSAVGAYFALADAGLKAALQDAPRIAAAGTFWAPFGEAEGDLRIIGPFVNNAPEFTTVEGDGVEPGLIKRAFGAGHATWLPWQIGALYHRFMMPDYRAVAAHLINEEIGQPPVETTAPLAVEMILYRHPDGMVLHFLNRSATQTKGLTELTPLAGFEFTVAGNVEAALSLTDNKRLPIRRAGQKVIFSLDRLDHFAAIALVS